MKYPTVVFLLVAMHGLFSPPARGTPPEADRGKRLIERPTRALTEGGNVDATPNARVEPGLVRWHPDLDAARAAAGNSGKPVLLFQMMGRLDDRFC